MTLSKLIWDMTRFSGRVLPGNKISGKIITGMRHYLTDVYIISYPKCGRTWLRMLLGKIITDKYHLDSQKILETFEITLGIPSFPSIVFSHDDRPNLKKANMIRQNKLEYKNKKIVFLIREPKDVIVSYYFQYTKRRSKYNAGDAGFNGSIHDFVRYPIGSIDSLIRFYNIWAESRSIPKDFLCVRYEDLHKNIRHELKRIYEFIGVEEPSEKIIERAINYCSFKNMQKIEKNGLIKSNRLKTGNRSDPESLKVRKGIVGGHNEYLNDEDISYLNKKIDSELNSFYHFYKTEKY